MLSLKNRLLLKNEQIKKAIYQQAFIQAPKANAEYVRKVRNIFRPQRL
jgi:hypothetical protein